MFMVERFYFLSTQKRKFNSNKKVSTNVNLIKDTKGFLIVDRSI